MRLIDGDEVAKVFKEKSKQYADLQPTQNWGAILTRLADIIDMVPTIDAEPVRHGKWIMGRDMMYCSECSESYDKGYRIDYEYCPNCGASMEAEE